MNNIVEDKIIKSLRLKIKNDESITMAIKEKMVIDEIEKINYLKETWQKEFAQKRILKILENNVEPQNAHNKKTNSFSAWPIAGWVIGATSMKILYVYNSKLPTTLLVLGAVYLLGFLTGKIINKKNWQNSNFIKFITWFNLISWVLPGLGILLSSIALTIKISDQKLSKRYRVLGYIGLSLSLLNSIIYTLYKS